MPDPRTRFLLPLVLIAGTAALYAQGPFQTREPPLADEVDPAEVKGRFDPDEPVQRAQHTTPGTAPATLPGEILTTPGVVPAQYTRVVAPAGELPTPVVTLNIDGNEAAPTGQPVVYKLHVRNASRAKAHNVVVRVIPPKNAEPIHAEPPPTKKEEIDTTWELKTLEPGQTKTIEVSYKPKDGADEVKVQARVQYDFGRGMVTKVSAPSLTVKWEGPETMVVGETATFRIRVTNTGKVTVRDIEVKEFLNKGLVYDDREPTRGSVDGRLVSSIDPKTGERLWSIPAIGPGQVRVVEYRVKARDPGKVGNTVLVNAPGVKLDPAGGDTEVLTANLQMKATGPESGTVGQPAVYNLAIENRGSADLRNVVVRCTFPPDMRVTKATNGGQPFRDSVQWIFRELKKGESKDLNVGLTTTSPGLRTVQFTARADKATEQRGTARTEFAGVPSLDWDTEVPGTEPVGKAMTYRVTIANRGTAPAKKVEVKVDLPRQVDLDETRPHATTGLGENASQQVMFAPFDIQPGKKTTLVIRVKARSSGEARAIFWLKEDGKDALRHDKTTNITPTDSKSPSGPPPKPNTSRVGSSPGE
ncbi:MAG TPA: hypothetical protein VKD90_05630 [Gemmataceae bacterium]|nr:hypothetical protein [Gemmataceae bacterium]